MQDITIFSLNNSGDFLKEIIEKVLNKENIHYSDKIQILSSLAHEGLCNGYYFGITGQDYYKREIND